MEEKKVISASRTKDLVRCSPGLLAGILAGREPVRFSLNPKLNYLDIRDVGCLVLWTKNPANMLDNPELRRALRSYSRSSTIILNLSVTGLGGSVLEPGIEREEKILEETKRIIDAGMVTPGAVIIRYDPLIRVRCRNGKVVGNFSIETAERIVEAFSSIGVERFKTSLVDLSYAHVPSRLKKLGIEPDIPSRHKVIEFINDMQKICGIHNAQLDVCCHPGALVDEKTRGCIDGKHINEILRIKGAPWRVTETPHNLMGRQRKTCVCTYSRDIGYSTGITSCFKSAGACLYCYSQRNMSGQVLEGLNTLIHPGTRQNSNPRRWLDE